MPDRGQERVLVLTSSYPRFAGDPAGHFVESEAKSLAQSGHQLTVLCAGRGDGPRKGLGPIRLLFLGGPGLFDHPGALPRLKEHPTRLLSFVEPSTRVLALRLSGFARNFDRVIAHWLIPSALPWALSLVPKTTDLEVVVHGSDLRLLLSLPQPVRRFLLETLSRRKLRLRFVSQQLKDELLDSSLPDRVRKLVAAGLVRPAELTFGELPAKRDARRHLGALSSRPLVVLVGRLIEEKRIEVGLRALSLVPSLDVVVLGDGPLQSVLKARFPHVRFLGNLPREGALLWIRAADLLLSASRLEGAPTAIREARALGTAVVAADCGDLSRWAQHDPDLWMVD